MSNRLKITSKTRIRELIDAYPELEEKLVVMAPAFGKLKNPVLRSTIARVTSISQAAFIGNVDVNQMVNQLRQAVGQELLFIEPKTKTIMNQIPEWLNESHIKNTIDARPMLEAGQHPISIVFEELGKIKSGEILKLITGFVPAPLLDKAKDKGHLVYTVENSPKEFHSFFCKT
ncbi:MAG: DUF1858 domain-containing protein [Bacteroidales bacterium]|nr:DUF1858 domain-containing protein [Bacteroidales bacterium]